MPQESENSAVGAFEAKTHLSRLLKRVAQGETITITRHGAPVARLVPVEPGPDLVRRRQAIAGIRALSRRHVLEGDLKSLIEEGRE